MFNKFLKTLNKIIKFVALKLKTVNNEFTD